MNDQDFRARLHQGQVDSLRAENELIKASRDSFEASLSACLKERDALRVRAETLSAINGSACHQMSSLRQEKEALQTSLNGFGAQQAAWLKEIATLKESNESFASKCDSLIVDQRILHEERKRFIQQFTEMPVLKELERASSAKCGALLAENSLLQAQLKESPSRNFSLQAELQAEIKSLNKKIIDCCAANSVLLTKNANLNTELTALRNKNPMPTTKDTHMTMLQQIQDSKAIAVLKVDATDAAWRTAGSQFVKLTKEPLVALLSRHLGPDDESMRSKIAAFLDTELGSALLSALLATGLSAIPGESDAVPAMMGRELRVRALAGAGDAVADVLMGPLREVASAYLQAPKELQPPNRNP